MTHILLLTAPRGAGKTTACQRFLSLARDAGLRVGGITAPACYDGEGHKTGIAIVDALSGEQHALATTEHDVARRTIGTYRFDPEVMRWALERVLLALGAPLDVVLVDEIGPLELTQARGLIPALDYLPQARAALAILVVRTELLIPLQERLANLQTSVVSMTLANRDQVPAQLLEAAWGLASQRRETPRNGRDAQDEADYPVHPEHPC